MLGYRIIHPSNVGVRRGFIFGFFSSPKYLLKLRAYELENKEIKQLSILSSLLLNRRALFLKTKLYSSDYPYEIIISEKLIITS